MQNELIEKFCFSSIVYYIHYIFERYLSPHPPWNLSLQLLVSRVISNWCSAILNTRSAAAVAAIVCLTLALNNLVDETRTSIVPFKMSNHQALSQAKFAWTCLILQICFGILFVLLVRYSESADASHTENQKGEDTKIRKDLKHNLEKYPAILDGKLNCNYQNFRL